MKNQLTIPTTDPSVQLVEMSTPQDDAALLMALRETPHALRPDQEGAPDHREFTYMPFIRESNPGTKQLGIRADDRIVGVIDLVPDETDESRMNIDYKVGPNERRKGFASKAVQAAAEYATGELGKEVVTLEIVPGNIASRGVARRNNFIRTENGPKQVTYTYLPRTGSETPIVSVPASQVEDLEIFEATRRAVYEDRDPDAGDLSALAEVAQLKSGHSLLDQAAREILSPDDEVLKAAAAARDRAQRITEALGDNEVFYDMVLGGTPDEPVSDIVRRTAPTARDAALQR